MNQISKSFANVTALNAVTLLLNPGEIHGLIGENGAGKSTLIKILAGVYQADSGNATLDRVRGMDITFVTSATNDEEGRALLKHLGFPFKAVDDPKKQKAKRGPAFYAKKKK